MLAFLIFCCLSLFSCTATPSLTPPTASASSHTLQDTLRCETIRYRQQDFDVVYVDLRKDSLQLYWRDTTGKPLRSLANLKKLFAQQGRRLRFGMNAGMYLADRSPQGLYIENGKIIQPIIPPKKGYGNFYLQPNGVFYFSGDSAKVCTTEQYLQRSINANYATQSGPMLVIDQQLHPVFVEGSKNLNIRNGVGVISPHELVFVISKQEVNLYDFAMLFKEKLHCANALYLDGFISQAYLPRLNRKQLGGNFGVMIGL